MNDLESTLRARLHDLAGAAPDADGGDSAGAARDRHHRQRRNRMAVLAVCAGLVVVAGGSTAAGALLSSAGPDGDVVTVPEQVTTPAPSLQPTPTPRPTPPSSAAPSAPSAAPSSSAESSAPSVPSSPAPSSPAPSSRPPVGSAPTAPTPDEPAAWPAEATAVQGGTYWAVFLDVSWAGDTAGEQEARAALSEAGYLGSSGDIGCAQGAAEALGLDPALSYTGVWVEFPTAADAQRFVDLYQPGVVGTARITAYCLD